MRCIILLLIVCSGLRLNAQTQYEWIVDNTHTNPGERIVAIIDAGDLGNYDGVQIIGTVVGNNGNWGDELPTVSPFMMYLRYSGILSYEILQERQTINITLRLRKVSTSVYHLTANIPTFHRGARVYFRQVIGYPSITMGSPTVNDSSGELVISEPKYSNHFTGNLGIGITNPNHKLSVDGIISAKEVKVSSTPNSDYVFEPDYNLKSIEEVDQFIKENKHLPDIPSTQEFKENGIGLGEMDDMLLRKIEELTLYVIELKKENAEMKSLNSDLNKRIEKLENEY